MTWPWRGCGSPDNYGRIRQRPLVPAEVCDAGTIMGLSVPGGFIMPNPLGLNRYTRVPLEVRFWSRVKKTDKCWLWMGGKYNTGYGSFQVKGKHVLAHRYAYECLVGSIPVGLELDHLCRVHACVKPSHLELVSHRENCRRGKAGKYLAARTHCPKGHPYDLFSTEYRQEGHRRCRACRNKKIASLSDAWEKLQA